jgi:hypothetical protein
MRKLEACSMHAPESRFELWYTDLFGGTVSSSRYPGSVLPLVVRERYCPSTTSSSRTRAIDLSTLTFSLRISSASRLACSGGRGVGEGQERRVPKGVQKAHCSYTAS